MDESTIRRLDALFAPFARSNEPGCTVAVSRAGLPIYRRAFGMADLEEGLANSPSVLMPAGSIAKQFTCAALLLLESEGKVALSDTLGKWLPELSPEHHEVTLAQLMRHQGGVRCYLDHWMFNGYRTMEAGLPWTIQQRQRHLNFEPGTRTAYTNGGYLLLSKVIELASNMSFGPFVERRLFRPAGMYASRMAARAAAGPGVALTYAKDAEGGWSSAAPITEDAWGDGGLITSVDDLLRWAAFLRGGSGLLNLAALKAADEPWAPGPSDYRFGLIFHQWRGVCLAHHAGGLPGASSMFLMVPKHELDLALLFNRNGPAVTLALNIVETLLGSELGHEPSPPASADYEDLLGTYLGRDSDFVFALTEIEGRLALSLFGDAPFALETWAGDDADLPFWADAGAAQIRFRRGQAPGDLEYFDGSCWSSAQRVDAGKVEAPTIATTEAYRSPEADATLRLESQEGRLFLIVDAPGGRARYETEPVAPDLLRFWPPQFPAGKLVRIVRKRGEACSLVVTTQRTRGLTFPRIENEQGKIVGYR